MARAVSKDQDVIKRFIWTLASVNVHLDELRDFWANTLGVSGPQWLILMAIADLDQSGRGVPVNVVSKKLHVDASFVTTQSKLLEKNGLLHRKPSAQDGRIVEMSLTEKTYKQLAGLAGRQEALNAFIFEDFNDNQLSDMTDLLASLQNRLSKALFKALAGS